MPAIIRNIVALPADSERRRKMPSRTSGVLVRDSITRKTANSAAAPYSRPMTRPEPQPQAPALTSA